MVIATSPARGDDSVRIELEGTIPVACGVTAISGSFDFKAALAGASQQLAMGVDCNVPYTLTASSRHGGLISDAATGPGVVNAVGYDLSLMVPTTGGGQVRLNCTSAEMKAGASGVCAHADSGNEISVGQSAALIMTLKNAGLVLAAGDYGDVIVVEVVPRT